LLETPAIILKWSRNFPMSKPAYLAHW